MKRKYLILFSLAGFVLCCDQLTKHLVHRILELNAKLPLVADCFDLTYLRNTGFGFGLLARAPDSLKEIFFIGVPVFSLILIVLIFIKLQDDQLETSIALTTILGGAIGNLIDRIEHGYVIDFLSFHWHGHYLPAFNFADCSILFGVALMFLNTWRLPSQEASNA